MEDFANRLSKIAAQTKKIIENNQLLQKENVTLTEQKLDLKLQLESKEQQISELNERVKVLKLAKSISGSEVSPEKTELKRKINEYIKEVDKCIAMLNE